MALTLSFNKSDRFTLKHDENIVQFEVKVVDDQAGGSVECLETGRVFDIASDKGAEIYPDVFVSEGYKAQSDVLKLVFRAPREIIILREELAEED